MRDLIHMSAAEREAYAAWIKRIVHGLKGSIAQRLRTAAKEIQQGEQFNDQN